MPNEPIGPIFDIFNKIKFSNFLKNLLINNFKTNMPNEPNTISYVPNVTILNKTWLYLLKCKNLKLLIYLVNEYFLNVVFSSLL